MAICILRALYWVLSIIQRNQANCFQVSSVEGRQVMHALAISSGAVRYYTYILLCVNINCVSVPLRSRSPPHTRQQQVYLHYFTGGTVTPDCLVTRWALLLLQHSHTRRHHDPGTGTAKLHPFPAQSPPPRGLRAITSSRVWTRALASEENKLNKNRDPRYILCALPEEYY